MGLNTLLLVAALNGAPRDSLLCPAYPGDPPWRWMTCYIWLGMRHDSDRPFLHQQQGKPVEIRWQ
jgi:hypothetical protein